MKIPAPYVMPEEKHFIEQSDEAESDINEFKIKLIKIAEKYHLKKKKQFFRGLMEMKVYKTLTKNSNFRLPPISYTQ